MWVTSQSHEPTPASAGVCEAMGLLYVPNCWGAGIKGLTAVTGELSGDLSGGAGNHLRGLWEENRASVNMEHKFGGFEHDECHHRDYGQSYKAMQFQFIT